MNPARMIYEDAPAFIPVPADLQHHRVEAIFWPLEDKAAQSNVTGSAATKSDKLRAGYTVDAVNRQSP